MNFSRRWLNLSFCAMLSVSSCRIMQGALGRTRIAMSSIASEAKQGASKELVFFFNDNQKVQLPDGHKFPMDKYRRTRDILEAEYADRSNLIFRESPMATIDELLTTHCPDYVNRFLTGTMTEREIRVSGFPWTEKGVKRALTSVGGTIAATRYVMDNGGIGSGAVSAHLAGGTHHAMYAHAEGFCIFSDIAVAANLALKEYPELKKILIIDCDVHQGNGNAVLFKEDERVVTFSMQCEGNIFSKKQQSDVDVDLPIGVGDVEYLAKLRSWLAPFLMDIVKPDLVFFQSGVDSSEFDRLGKLKMTREGLRTRNALIYTAVKRRGIPLVVTMGGGYPKSLDPQSEAFQSVIGAHADVYKQIVEHYG